MKKMIFALVMMLTSAVSASAMSYEQARNEALFLTDKMAYELNLTDAQYEAAYEINLDYLMSVATVDDVFGVYWERRNLDLSYILYSWQWDAFRAATYFYRPLYWDAGYWHFGIYARYPHRDYFYFGRPHFYATYRGGHSWHLNGGHSYYHGRSSHFRPAIPQGRQHVGMRDGFNRGDFRNSRGGSSTRITGRQGGSRPDNFNRGNSNMNRGNRDMNRGNRDMNRGNSGTINRSNSEVNRGNSEINRSNSGSVNRGNNSGQFGGRSINRESSSPSRSIGGSRSVGSTPSHSSRSVGASHSSGPSHSGGASRSAGPSRGGGTSNSHGHFGGNRR